MKLERNIHDFLLRVGKIMSPKMNMSIYKGEYLCACSQKHLYPTDIKTDFDLNSLSGLHSMIMQNDISMMDTKVLAEGRMLVIFQCPKDPRYITAVKIKQSFLKFKGFKTICGYKLDNEEEILAFSHMINKLR